MVFLFFAFLLSYFFTFYYLCRHENGITVVYAAAAGGMCVCDMACLSVAAVAHMGQMAGGGFDGNGFQYAVSQPEPPAG